MDYQGYWHILFIIFRKDLDKRHINIILWHKVEDNIFFKKNKQINDGILIILLTEKIMGIYSSIKHLEF